MKKQIKGIYVNHETGDTIFDPYISVITTERSYLKITRSTLAKIIDDLAGQNLSIKILAVIINNTSETNNHVYFSKNRLIEFFADYKEEVVVKAFERLKRINFFKELSKNELVFNPRLIAFRDTANYERILAEYLGVKYQSSKTKGKKIKEIVEISCIPQFDNSLLKKKNFEKNAIFDFHYAKVKSAFIEKLKTLPSKKIKILADILLAIKDNDKDIIVCKLGISANKETVSNVVKYLRGKEILINSIRKRAEETVLNN